MGTKIECMETLQAIPVIVLLYCFCKGFGSIGLKVASPVPTAKVKRIALIAFAASLLAACQSSQEFCAEYKAGDAKNAQTLKKLGLKQERNWFYNPQKLERYCL